ncbi:GNAT family N-acetyltransferase [Saccharothrix sp. Mg75]|uniref:GNAT family N-acetyltransferase n=1 Tax=Saccharothrix sp. Mg75 TaxID=3445357 RepID=UPI003EEAEE85
MRTGLATGPGTRDVATGPVAEAEAAARAAGVRVRALTDLADLAAVQRLFDGVWRPDPANPPITTELMRALTKAGNYVAGAYDGTALVGAAAGFFGPPAEAVLHSHITGVAPTALGRGVGYALKLHQRAWAAARGVAAITWTFDPLVSRNAHFNLTKLGAEVVEYLPDFYGSMRDGINADDESDRVLVRWDVRAPLPGPAAPPAGTARVPVPPDVAALRAATPEAAGDWRRAVRAALAPLLAAGGRVVGFDRADGYLVEGP